ncbi:hypothetical protein ACFLX5_02215 [Chloroflexota bacterium]
MLIAWAAYTYWYKPEPVEEMPTEILRNPYYMMELALTLYFIAAIFMFVVLIDVYEQNNFWARQGVRLIKLFLAPFIVYIALLIPVLTVFSIILFGPPLMISWLLLTALLPFTRWIASKEYEVRLQRTGLFCALVAFCLSITLILIKTK